MSKKEAIIMQVKSDGQQVIEELSFRENDLEAY